MKNDHDLELIRRFGEIREPSQDELFVERVTKRIARHRYAHRVMLILLAFVGAAILAVLTPWLIALTGHITMGTNLFAHGVVAAILSPAGCSIGGAVGLFLFFKARS